MSVSAPLARLPRILIFCPSPESIPDVIINGAERLLRRDRLLLIGPPAKFRIQLVDQPFGVITRGSRRVAALRYGLCEALFLFSHIVEKSSTAKAEEFTYLSGRFFRVLVENFSLFQLIGIGAGSSSRFSSGFGRRSSGSGTFGFDFPFHWLSDPDNLHIEMTIKIIFCNRARNFMNSEYING